MASGLDSEAVFSTRAKNAGLDAAVVALLARGGVKTYGSFAFITPYRPGQSDEAPFTDALQTVLGRAPSNPELIVLRRLFFEACTLAVTDIKQQSERDATSEPVRMAIAERNQRLADQKARLTGLHFAPETEPSHKLVDTICQMGADQSLQWAPWEQLTSRASEITHTEKDWKISFDSAGALKVAQKNRTPEASMSGELKVRAALNRRARAFDLASLCSYTSMEAWHERLFGILEKEVPANAIPVTLQQAREADKTLFRLLSQATQGALTQAADGTRPMEKQLENCMNHAEVHLCLIPMIKAGKSSEDVVTDPKKKKKGKGDIKKDGPPNPMTLPPGCHQMTREKKPICNLFNRDKCQFAKPGKRCRRGFHVCWRCFKHHPFQSCDQS